MFFTKAELIYTALSKSETGSPVTLELTEDITVSVEELFSSYYYRDNKRNMRKSRNISIPSQYVFDRNENGLNYELNFVILNGIKYQIKDILKHQSTSLMTLLDCEQV